MTPAEYAGAIFTLVVVGLVVFFGTRPRTPKGGNSDATARYIEEMRSHLRRRAARDAATHILLTGARR